MPKLVNLPNGNQGSFPDDMSWEDIQSVLNKQFPVTIEGEKSPESLLNIAGGLANKYINEPVENIGRQSLEFGAGAGQGVANTGVGVRNLLAKGANLLPGVNVGMEKGFNEVPRTPSSMVGDLLGLILGGNAVGSGIRGVAPHIEKIPHIANAVKKASDIIGKSPLAIQKALKTGKNVGENALVGAAVSPEQQGLGAALGAGGAALGAGLGYAAPKIANKLGLGTQPGRETIEGLTREQVAPSVEAAERLGTPLRPSEASKNPFLAGLEGKYPRTREAAFENVKLGTERLEGEKKAINNLLNNIYDKSTASDNKIRGLYETAYRWNLKPDVVNQLKSDPILADAFNAVSKDSAWQRKLKDIPENNYAYLDKVRKSISDQEGKLMRAGEKSRAAEYTDARTNLVDLMDSASPAYAKARAEAQKKIVRSTIEKKMASNEYRGTDFFKKIIKNEQKFDDLLKSLKNVPEAQSQLKDMKSAWHSLINVEKPSSSSYQAEKALDQARGSLNRVFEMWHNLTGKKKNAEAVKFIRSDKWFKELENANKSGDKEKIENTLSNILGKILPTGYEEIKKGASE